MQRLASDVKGVKEFSANCYSKGDLVYGNRETRAEVVTILEDMHEGPFFIDVYNNLASVFDLSNVSQPENKAIKKAVSLHAFAKKMEREIYMSQIFAKNMAGESPKLTCSGLVPTEGCELLNPFIKKRCKLGVLWNVMEKKHQVHFVLDSNFDINLCFTKQVVRYTCSEMRFVYRNWEILGPLQKVKFWKESEGQFIETPAPWEEHPELVASYTPKHPDKYVKYFNSMTLFEKMNRHLDGRLSADVESTIPDKNSAMDSARFFAGVRNKRTTQDEIDDKSCNEKQELSY